MMATALLTMAVLASGAAARREPTACGRRGTPRARNAAHEFTLTIKTSDGAISGTVSSPRGSVPITKGTISGRDLAFTVTRRANYDEIDVTFTGTIEGDVMKLRMQVAGREAVSMTARREAGSGDVR